MGNFKLLFTEEDKTGFNLDKMSDFLTSSELGEVYVPGITDTEKQLFSTFDHLGSLRAYKTKRVLVGMYPDFFLARDKIRLAQETSNQIVCENELKAALFLLNKVKKACYRDILDSSQKAIDRDVIKRGIIHRKKYHRIFGSEKRLRKFMGYVVQDWLCMTKSVSLELRILNYLGHNSYFSVLNDYINKCYEFCNTIFSKNAVSYAMFFHLSAPYSSKNDWMNLIELTNVISGGLTPSVARDCNIFGQYCDYGTKKVRRCLICRRKIGLSTTWKLCDRCESVKSNFVGIIWILIYLLAPIDVIPELFLGPLGFVEDAILLIVYFPVAIILFIGLIKKLL